MRIRIAETITIELGVRNTGATKIVASAALHTYFAVSDVRQVRVHGVQGAGFIDTLDDWREKTQVGELEIHGETDRLYLGLPDTLRIEDPGWGRDIVIQTSHSRSAVIWNPWIDKSRRLSQFDDDAWQGMLCIETARVWDDLLHVEPGDVQYFAVHMRVQDASD